MAVVIFNYQDWQAAYPELASVTEPQAQAFFNRAGIILNNTDSSIVSDIPERTNLLYLLTAHIAALSPSLNKASAAGLVGRIVDAQEGTVKIGVQADLGASAGAAWYQQTQYGLLYWLATAPYRTARYVAPHPRRNPFAFGIRRGVYR